MKTIPSFCFNYDQRNVIGRVKSLWCFSAGRKSNEGDWETKRSYLFDRYKEETFLF